MSDKYYVVWRIDGEFEVTEISKDLALNEDSEYIMKYIIENDDDLSLNEKKELIEIATDYDSSLFQGYEMLFTFKGEITNVF